MGTRWQQLFLHLITGQAWLYEPSNTLRLVTGMGCGLAIGAVVHPLYQAAIWHDVDDRPVLENIKPRALPNGGCCRGIGLLVWPGAPYTLWAVLLFVAVVTVFTLVNSILVVLLFHREGLVVRHTELIPYMLAGLVLSVIEIGTLAILHALIFG